MAIKRVGVLFIAFILILPIVYSLTAAVGNARAVLNMNASPEKPAVLQRTILVQNRNEIPIKATLMVDKKFEKFIEIIDKELTVEPGKSKNARYTLTMDRGGDFEIKINVLFESADPTIKENKVGMSATLIIHSNGPIINDTEEIETEPIKPEEDEPITGPKNPFLEVEPAEEESTEEIPIESEVSDEDAEKESIKAGPLIGTLIILVIIGVGLGVYFIIQKLK